MAGYARLVYHRSATHPLDGASKGCLKGVWANLPTHNANRHITSAFGQVSPDASKLRQPPESNGLHPMTHISDQSEDPTADMYATYGGRHASSAARRPPCTLRRLAPARAILSEWEELHLHGLPRPTWVSPPGVFTVFTTLRMLWPSLRPATPCFAC